MTTPVHGAGGQECEAVRALEGLTGFGHAVFFQTGTAALESHAIDRRVRGEDYPAGQFLQTIGDIELRLGRHAQAVKALEDALRAHERHRDDPAVRASTNARLARAL